MAKKIGVLRFNWLVKYHKKPYLKKLNNELLEKLNSILSNQISSNFISF